MPKLRCLRLAAHSLDSKIAGRQVARARLLSPAAHSLDVRIAGCQVPRPRCERMFRCSLEVAQQ